MKRLALIFLLLISAETANAQWGRYSGESGVVVISTGGVAARFMPAADTDSARGAAFAAAMAAHKAGDRIILGPGRYDVSTSFTPLDGAAIVGNGGAHVYGTGLSDPLFIIVNDDITISDLKITSDSTGIGVHNAVTQVARGIVLRNLNVQVSSAAGNAVLFGQLIGGGTAAHEVELTAYDSIFHSGVSSGFGVYTYGTAEADIKLFNCDIFGFTDGVLFSGETVATIYGGTYASTLDAITSGLDANVTVIGARARGDQADIYSDDGDMTIYWADARSGSVVGNNINYAAISTVIGNLQVFGNVETTGVIKNGSTTRVSSQFNKTNTTLANVTGLSATLENAKTYFFRAQLVFDANVTGGHKYAMSGTATASAIRYNIISTCDATLANVITSRQTALNGSAGQAGCAAGVTTIEGYITTSAAGTLTVQFAQNAASGTSSILVGSKFEFQEVS